MNKLGYVQQDGATWLWRDTSVNKNKDRLEHERCLLDFFFFLFPVNDERNTQVSSSIRPDNANGRVGMNGALTISANCCFVLCFCCCCQRQSAQGSAWKGLLGELLSQPGLPTCTCTGRSRGSRWVAAAAAISVGEAEVVNCWPGRGVS